MNERFYKIKTKKEIIIFLTSTFLTENEEKRIAEIRIKFLYSELVHCVYSFDFITECRSEQQQCITLKLTPDQSMNFGEKEEVISKSEYFKMKKEQLAFNQ